MQLARVETVEELIEQLPAPLSQLLSQADSLTEIENRMEHYTLSATRTLLQYSTSGITRVFCYVLLRESEIHLLQSIIKGKMLAFDEALIHQAIGMKK